MQPTLHVSLFFAYPNRTESPVPIDFWIYLFVVAFVIASLFHERSTRKKRQTDAAAQQRATSGSRRYEPTLHDTPDQPTEFVETVPIESYILHDPDNAPNDFPSDRIREQLREKTPLRVIPSSHGGGIITDSSPSGGYDGDGGD